MMDSWDTEETHLQQLTTIIKSLAASMIAPENIL